MRLSLHIIFSALLLMCSSVILAQVNTYAEEEIKSEIAKRGISEEELLVALDAKGYEFTSFEDLDLEELEQIQTTILEIENSKLNSEKSIDFIDDEDQEKSVSPTSDTLVTPLSEDNRILTTKLNSTEASIIYGQDLLRSHNFRLLQAADEYLVPSSYLIGYGDELAVSIYGRSQLDQRFVVDIDGYIKINRGSQRIFVSGLNLDRARNKLARVFSNYYSFNEGEFDLNLSSSRKIKINLYGELLNPGSTTMLGVNTALAAISSVGGLNELGSVRNIRLIRSSEEQTNLDLYQYMNDPSIDMDLFLYDNDIILVPVADRVVEVKGAVRRPMKYEMLPNESITDLIDYAGGFSNNAFKNKVKVKRYTDNGITLIDVDMSKSNSTSFKMINGDQVIVDTVVLDQRNYVTVTGAVINAGQFQRTENMRLSELIKKAGLKPESRTDIAFLKRMNLDGTFQYEQVNIEVLLNAEQSDLDLILRDKDLLTIWSKERFTDRSEFSISGAVRYPGSFAFDVGESIRIDEAILLSGGLRRDASDIAIIHRRDPLNAKQKEYLTIHNLSSIIENPDIQTNETINAFDSLVIYSKNNFQEQSYVSIEGAVNIPGLFQYGEGMTLKDLITLAGGFKMAASTDNIEVSRVIFKNNEQTRIIIENLELDRDIKKMQSTNEFFSLQPFDFVSVRYVPEFELQQNVTLRGEVTFPGQYTIVNDNETISSIIKRAGGVTKEAFPEGATLIRSDQEYGSVVIKLNEILENSNSQFNFTVRNGDTINVPKVKEFVTIMGATRVQNVLGEGSINEGNVIHVPFHKGKDVMYYINEYAGGLHDNADSKAIFVEHPNGEVKEAKRHLFGKKVEVRKGSLIRVNYKTEDLNKEGEKKDVDWTKVLGDSVTQAMSILTLILLVQRLD